MYFDLARFIQDYAADLNFQEFMTDIIESTPIGQPYIAVDDTGDEFYLSAEEVLIIRNAVINIRRGEEYGGN
jgi:hypothetical protein